MADLMPPVGRNNAAGRIRNGGATIDRPSIDTNQAQQPGGGVGTRGGASGGATIKR
jgi:hypothetical protein